MLPEVTDNYSSSFSPLIIHIPFYLFSCPSYPPFTYLPSYLCIFLSIYLPICLSVSLSVCLPTISELYVRYFMGVSSLPPVLKTTGSCLIWMFPCTLVMFRCCVVDPCLAELWRIVVPLSFVTHVRAKVGQPGIGSGRSLCLGAKRCASLVAGLIFLVAVSGQLGT